MTPESEYPICEDVSLSENLQILLIRRKLEQKELAKRLTERLKKDGRKGKVAPNTVSDWVTGKTHPRHQTLLALADVLQTTVAKLVA